jgi:alpha-L-rhamnosidase
MLALASLSAAPDAKEVRGFVSAKAVWPEARESEKNLFTGFQAVFERPDSPEPVTLRIAASTVYRAFINGEFCGYGPARGPHGFYRVDVWDVTSKLRPERNVVAIEVAGYNANSYYLLDQPSFLQAEVLVGSTVLAATGKDPGFQAAILTERVQKVQRYSFQRPFIEVYRFTPESHRWRKDPESDFCSVPCATQPEKPALPRRVPSPAFDILPALTLVSSGKALTGQPVERPWKDRSLTDIGPKLGGYPETELDLVVSQEMQEIRITENNPVNTPLPAGQILALPEGSFHILDLGRNMSGFPRLEVTCLKPGRLLVSFDETLSGTEVNWRRLGCVNVLTYDLEAGSYTLEAFEPYTLRYLQILCVSGECTVSQAGLRTYENPDTARATFAAADERLNRLFEAGRATFAQNALDVFMDCPHRERAGWLCDSFFTARSAMSLSGNTSVERNFLENYLLPERFAHLPEGMLPMCYPADHNDGVFIPNWAMWFVVELGEYLDRGGDRATVDALKPRVLALFDYFKPFLNSDGLLEKLESWVFVEWSAANKFTQDVNYPSNMLYAAALSTAARLYGLPELESQAQQMRLTIRKHSYDGEFFVDNAVRQDGRFEVTRNRTEVCQYFAFFFDVATPDTHPELWTKLRDEFGPKRRETKAHQEIHEANSFIGNMLRLELLSRYGLCQQLLDESIDYLDYMAVRTGTLWENVGDYASLNHGFASHIVHTLQRDALGVYRIDPVNRLVQLRFTPLTLPWCKGRIPIGNETLSPEWKREGGTLRYRLAPPEGYQVTVDNQTGGEVIAE